MNAAGVSMAAERYAVQPPQARRNERIKNPTISRAKRSTALPGWAARLSDTVFLLMFVFPIALWTSTGF
jgi:hypothetical protein